MICDEILINDHALALYDSLIKAWINSGLSEERNTRIAAIEQIKQELNTNINEINNAISSLNRGLEEEKTLREEAVNTLTSELSALSSNFSVLSAYTISQIADLQEWLHEVDSDLDAEGKNRIEADEQLANSIQQEINDRVSGDTYILDLFNAYKDITTEQIDFLFGDRVRVSIEINPKFAEYLTASAKPKFANEGEMVTFTAVIANNSKTIYVFDGWYVNGVKESENLVFTTTFSKNNTYEPRLREVIPEYVIRFTSNDDSMGNVYAEIDGESVTEVIVREGESIKFTPYGVPVSGYKLVGWSDGLENGVETTLSNIMEDKTFVATFSEIVMHRVEFFSNGNGSVYVNSPGTTYLYVEDGHDITFVPYSVPDDGYVLDYWSDGLNDGVENTVTNVQNRKEFYATFKESGGEPTDTTYTFNSKSWGVGDGDNWISNKDGNQMLSGRGIQITTGASGANADSPRSYNNVTKVVVVYSTNASKGTGSITVTVNGVEYSSSVTTDGGASDRPLEFAVNGDSGNINLLVTCTANSIYIKSITITHEE